jgi:hypothetical protein
MKFALCWLLLTGALLAQPAPAAPAATPAPDHPATDKPGADKRKPDPADLARLCELQRQRILVLEADQMRLGQEINRLQEEVRRLEQVIANIRAQVGSPQPGPNSGGSPRRE